jgi:putative tricarboxylic transport membrane protein
MDGAPAKDLVRSWHPEREVEIVAGTPAGGGQDRPARSLAGVLERGGSVGVPVKVTNIPGLGGGNAWSYLATRAGDPHVLAVNSPTLITNRLCGVSPLDFTMLTPLANLYTEYIVFVGRVDAQIASAAQLLRQLRADASAIKISIATAIGNVNHIALAQITQSAGGDVKALDLNVFDSARYAVADVLNGGAAVAAVTAASVVPELAAGTLRALAISAPRRLPGQFEHVPTWTELGVPCVRGTWRGLIGARGLTAAHLEFWDRVLAVAAGSEQWAGELAAHYWSTTYLGSKATSAFLRRETTEMESTLTTMGILN